MMNFFLMKSLIIRQRCLTKTLIFDARNKQYYLKRQVHNTKYSVTCSMFVCNILQIITPHESK